MPKNRKNKIISCKHFAWRLVSRNGTWYADGRSNEIDAGRHSLGTTDRKEAIQRVHELDQVRAEDLGLAPRSLESSEQRAAPLTLEAGRKLYEKYIARPRVTGGVRKSTQKRYRTVFDKFIEFARGIRIECWNQVTAEVLTDYASHLASKGYAYKTLRNELTTLKQAVRYLIKSGRLPGMSPIELKLRKAESQPAYCYRFSEVEAMVIHCQSQPNLQWLHGVLVTLACTGLRIAEVASLRWSDVDLERGRLSLTDETASRPIDGIQPRELKSGRSRSFPIHSQLLKVLKEVPRTGTFLFRGPRGGRLKPDTVRRVLVRELIEPLSEQFPTPQRERGFKNGRLHSFRHYFCSTCANSGVPERIVMDWLGHADSEMIRHYYHLHDEEARRRMDSLDFLGEASGRAAGGNEATTNEEDTGPISDSAADAD